VGNIDRSAQHEHAFDRIITQPVDRCIIGEAAAPVDRCSRPDHR
jgi:hypothetical protein